MSSFVVEREFTDRIVVQTVSLNMFCVVFLSLLRHVAQTDLIKDFVITEESSIAKGIRRIVAVTGEEAHECSRAAAEFSRRLDWIEGLSGKEKEQAMKPFLSVSVRLGIAERRERGLTCEPII